jgi:hypothetical protein
VGLPATSHWRGFFIYASLLLLPQHHFSLQKTFQQFIHPQLPSKLGLSGFKKEEAIKVISHGQIPSASSRRLRAFT